LEREVEADRAAAGPLERLVVAEQPARIAQLKRAGGRALSSSRWLRSQTKAAESSPGSWWKV
jgi:hypothetical protein